MVSQAHFPVPDWDEDLFKLFSESPKRTEEIVDFLTNALMDTWEVFESLTAESLLNRGSGPFKPAELASVVTGPSGIRAKQFLYLRNKYGIHFNLQLKLLEEKKDISNFRLGRSAYFTGNHESYTLLHAVQAIQYDFIRSFLTHLRRPSGSEILIELLAPQIKSTESIPDLLDAGSIHDMDRVFQYFYWKRLHDAPTPYTEVADLKVYLDSLVDSVAKVINQQISRIQSFPRIFESSGTMDKETYNNNPLRLFNIERAWPNRSDLIEKMKEAVKFIQSENFLKIAAAQYIRSTKLADAAISLSGPYANKNKNFLWTCFGVQSTLESLALGTWHVEAYARNRHAGITILGSTDQTVLSPEWLDPDGPMTIQPQQIQLGVLDLIGSNYNDATSEATVSGFQAEQCPTLTICSKVYGNSPHENHTEVLYARMIDGDVGNPISETKKIAAFLLTEAFALVHSNFRGERGFTVNRLIDRDILYVRPPLGDVYLQSLIQHQLAQSEHSVETFKSNPRDDYLVLKAWFEGSTRHADSLRGLSISLCRAAMADIAIARNAIHHIFHFGTDQNVSNNAVVLVALVEDISGSTWEDAMSFLREKFGMGAWVFHSPTDESLIKIGFWDTPFRRDVAYVSLKKQGDDYAAQRVYQQIEAASLFMDELQEFRRLYFNGLYRESHNCIVNIANALEQRHNRDCGSVVRLGAHVAVLAADFLSARDLAERYMFLSNRSPAVHATLLLSLIGELELDEAVSHITNCSFCQEALENPNPLSFDQVLQKASINLLNMICTSLPNSQPCISQDLNHVFRSMMQLANWTNGDREFRTTIDGLYSSTLQALQFDHSLSRSNNTSPPSIYKGIKDLRALEYKLLGMREGKSFHFLRSVEGLLMLNTAATAALMKLNWSLSSACRFVSKGVAKV